MPRQEPGVVRDLYRYSGLGLQFAAAVGIFAFAGRWLDGRWNTSPWLLIVGVFAGFALGLYSMTKKLPASPDETSGRDEPRDPA